MKNYIHAANRFLFFILFIPCISIYVFPQDFRVVQNGVEYSEFAREIDGKPVKMNLLRLDLTKVRLDVVHAMDAAIGLEKTSSIASRHGALAAVNAGFFRLDTSIFAGDAAGILKIDRRVLSEPYANRVALFIANGADKTDVVIDRLATNSYVKIGNHTLEVSGINRERKENDLVVFTPEFGRTTLTNPSGAEIVVQNGKIVSILNGKGSSLIPQKGIVISASGDVRERVLKFSKVGRKVSEYTTVSPNGNDEQNKSNTAYGSEDIVGGVPQLVRDGKIEITWQEEKSSKSFVETRHPRTAVAKLRDGKFLMITVDGRSEASAGIGLEDLAKLLLELGAVEAMNLDGGGSTTMFLDGKVVNRPSDKEGERRVSDAILVFPRAKK